MKEVSRRSELFAKEAADWVVVLGDADEQTRKAFAVWLRASPENVKEFLSVAAIWGTLPELSEQPSAEELVRLAAKQPNVVALPRAARSESEQPPAGQSSRRQWIARAAAIALVAVAIGAIFFVMQPEENAILYATLTGEQSSVPLPDGSVVNLNTQSRMRVKFSEEFRDVHLVEGEALFNVERDAKRPFRVITEHALIEAVHTQFNVRQDSNAVTVTVTEGVVVVSSATVGAGTDLSVDGQSGETDSSQSVRLNAGQQTQVGSDITEAVVVDTKVENAIAWRQHRLIFDALPLKQVIEEFNRYNDPPAVIEDRQLESLPISGVFRSNDRDSFLQFLSKMQIAEYARRADGVIVLKGGPADDTGQ